VSDTIVHETELDSAGWAGRPRLTCYTCDGKTLVKQPYMASWQWRKKVAEFANQHPSSTTTSYNNKIKADLESNAVIEDTGPTIN